MKMPSAVRTGVQKLTTADPNRYLRTADAIANVGKAIGTATTAIDEADAETTANIAAGEYGTKEAALRARLLNTSQIPTADVPDEVLSQYLDDNKIEAGDEPVAIPADMIIGQIYDYEVKALQKGYAANLSAKGKSKFAGITNGITRNGVMAVSNQVFKGKNERIISQRDMSVNSMLDGLEPVEDILAAVEKYYKLGLYDDLAYAAEQKRVINISEYNEAQYDIAAATDEADIEDVKNGLYTGAANESTLDPKQQKELIAAADKREADMEKRKNELYEQTTADLTSLLLTNSLTTESVSNALKSDKIDAPAAYKLNAGIASQRTNVVTADKTFISNEQGRIAQISFGGITNSETVKARHKAYKLRLQMLLSGVDANGQPSERRITGDEYSQLLKKADDAVGKTFNSNAYKRAEKFIRNETQFSEGYNFQSFGKDTTSQAAYNDFNKQLIQYINEVGNTADPEKWVNENKSRFRKELYDSDAFKTFTNKHPKYISDKFVTKENNKITGNNMDAIKADIFDRLQAGKISMIDAEQIYSDLTSITFRSDFTLADAMALEDEDLFWQSME